MIKSESVARNKFKQIIQIEGQPKEIFIDYTAEYYSITGVVDGRPMRVQLGKIGKHKAKLLEKMGLNVVREEKPSTRHVNIPGVISSKRTKNYTLLEVAAPTLEEKNRKVKKVEAQLARLGIKIRERCEWSCNIDKAKEAENPEVAPAKITIGKQEIKLDTAPPALKEAITKQLGEKAPYPECAKCGHIGHTTWCSHCTDGSRFEKGYRVPAKTKELQEMALKMGVK